MIRQRLFPILAFVAFGALLGTGSLAAQAEGGIAGQARAERGRPRTSGGAGSGGRQDRRGDRHDGPVSCARGAHRMAPGRRQTHRLSRRRARQRLRAGRRGGDGGFRPRGQSAGARAAGGHGPLRRGARPARDQHRAEDQRGRPARPADQQSRGGAGPRRPAAWAPAIAAGGSDRSRSSSMGWASRISSTPRAAAWASRSHPTC